MAGASAEKNCYANAYLRELVHCWHTTVIWPSSASSLAGPTRFPDNSLPHLRQRMGLSIPRTTVLFPILPVACIPMPPLLPKSASIVPQPKHNVNPIIAINFIILLFYPYLKLRQRELFYQRLRQIYHLSYQIVFVPVIGNC